VLPSVLNKSFGYILRPATTIITCREAACSVPLKSSFTLQQCLEDGTATRPSGKCWSAIGCYRDHGQRSSSRSESSIDSVDGQRSRLRAIDAAKHALIGECCLSDCRSTCYSHSGGSAFSFLDKYSKNCLRARGDPSEKSASVPQSKRA